VTIRRPLLALCLAAGIFIVASSHAALIGLTPSEPVLEFGASGIVSYDATTGIVTISGLPADLFRSDPFLFGEVTGTGDDDEKLISVQFRVDSSGVLISGIDGPDLVVIGAIDVDFDGVPDYDGTLLQAEVTQFGFQSTATGDSFFDLRLSSVIGALAPLYTGQDLALRVVSLANTEFPNSFNGSFAASFAGSAQGVLGSTAPAQLAACTLHVDAFCSVDGGPNKPSCRIKETKSPHHWAYEDRTTSDGIAYRRHTYGMHGLPMPDWANQYRATDVLFTYVVTNTGDTYVTGLLVDDSFDTPIAGTPDILAPGQSVTLTRTEALREKLEDIVLVRGQYVGAACSDVDTVVIKEKLRDRRRHDDDRYRDKGRRDDD
jgi:hypothetical protein